MLKAFTPLILFALSSQADLFEHLQSTRTINIGAGVAVSAQDDSGFQESASDGDGLSLGGYNYRNEAVGLSGFGLSTPYGGGGGSGRASQESEMTGERIFFNGFADVYVSASGGGQGSASASGGASSVFGYTFRILHPVTVRLDMSSAAPDEANSFYTFLLTGPGGVTVWDQTAIEENFQLLRTFSVPLHLQPGQYTIGADVSASSSADDGFGFAGQSRAEFTITPVPEPRTIALLTVAFLMSVVRFRQRAS